MTHIASFFTRRGRLAASVLVASALATGCVVPAPYYPAYQHSYPAYPAGYPEATQPAQVVPSSYVEYGHVARIEVTQGQTAGYGPSGGGAVAGGLIGGVLGNQIGDGTGRAAATALGVIGGALLGNVVESRQNAPRAYQSYRISIQTDQGAWRVFDVPHPGDLREGDRVRVEGGQISRY